MPNKKIIINLPMILFPNNNKLSLDNKWFTLLEAIFVLMIIGILSVIAIPKLEPPIRNSFQTLKKYSATGFESGRRAGELIEEIRLLSLKLSVKS